MKNIKKFFMFVFAFVISFGTFVGLCGCSKNNDGKINVVCTIFPEYDWVKEIIGSNNENINLTLLIDGGTDLHSFQPSVKDIAKIATCDLFIYIGGESDSWADDALKNATNKNMVVLKLLDVLGENSLDEDHEEGENHEEHEHEKDEHVWLSLKNTKIFVSEIANKLGEIDVEHKDDFSNNATTYNENLSELDLEYQSAVDSATVKTLVFGDRFPFKYLANDYGLTYYSAFSGCSAESEASFETIAKLSSKVDELGLKVILKIETSTDRIANQIKSNTKEKNQQILTMDSVQNTTIKSGKTYLGIMTDNLNVLKDALK